MSRRLTRSECGRRGRASARQRAGRLTGAVVAVAAAGLASACASTPESAPAEASALGAASAPAEDRSADCPALAKVKYPFLRCMRDAGGNVVFDSAPTLLEVSQMPALDPFVTSDAYWGD